MENLRDFDVDKHDNIWYLFDYQNKEEIEFSEYSDLVKYVFNLNEDLEVTDMYNETKIFIIDGEVKRFQTYIGEVEDELYFHWIGEPKEDDNGEPRRLSLYDVYSDRELL